MGFESRHARAKIKMRNPLAETGGDEMAAVLWNLIKEKLIEPFVDLKTEYYDLSITNREKTRDEVTKEAAQAILRLKVGVKCATITANEARRREYNLSALYPSPNATIRAILDGTVFRQPILSSALRPVIANWEKPVIIARHAFGDVYKNAEMKISSPGKVELLFTGKNGECSRTPLCEMESSGVVQGIFNLDDSIRSFAHSCFLFALEEGLPLWFSAKDTISKIYDGRFKEIFDELYEEEYKRRGVEYKYFLIDDAVAKIISGKGGVLWACKNYDGDVMSDMIASAAGALAMMRSVLVSPKGVYEYEAAHGTVQRHYYRYLKGEETGTNPIALIFAWTGALERRGALDGDCALISFAKSLERAVLDTVADGVMTGDLAAIALKPPERPAASNEFLDAAAERLARFLS